MARARPSDAQVVGAAVRVLLVEVEPEARDDTVPALDRLLHLLRGLQKGATIG